MYTTTMAIYQTALDNQFYNDANNNNVKYNITSESVERDHFTVTIKMFEGGESVDVEFLSIYDKKILNTKDLVDASIDAGSRVGQFALFLEDKLIKKVDNKKPKTASFKINKIERSIMSEQKTHSFTISGQIAVKGHDLMLFKFSTSDVFGSQGKYNYRSSFDLGRDVSYDDYNHFDISEDLRGIIDNISSGELDMDDVLPTYR